MTDRTKKIFLTICIVVPFLGYCIYYYSHMLKNAPYKFTEFDSFTLEYGPADSLVNKYNSKTGDYQYVTNQDSMVKTHVKLTREELLYLHHKASELGFWDFPVVEIGDTSARKNGAKFLRYVIEFKYKRKSKKVIFDESFNGDPKLRDANIQVVKEIMKVLNDEEGKQKN
jgi:hypothetical protein